MAFRARLVVYTRDNVLIEAQIRKTIERGGGAIVSGSARQAGAGSIELSFALRVAQADVLQGILDAVESIPGVSVMRATEPRPIKAPGV